MHHTLLNGKKICKLLSRLLKSKGQVCLHILYILHCQQNLKSRDTRICLGGRGSRPRCLTYVGIVIKNSAPFSISFGVAKVRQLVFRLSYSISTVYHKSSFTIHKYSQGMHSSPMEATYPPSNLSLVGQSHRY